MIQDSVIAEARSWLGTRFHHQGRAKKTAAHPGGVDCIGLIVGVANALNLKDKTGNLITTCDHAAYGHQPDSGKLEHALDAALIVRDAAIIQPADIVLFHFDCAPQHVGIAGQYPQGGMSLIHAYAQARKVVEHRFDNLWRSRISAVYCFPEIDGTPYY